MESSQSGRWSRLTNAAAIGLGAGLLLGGFFLLVLCVRALTLEVDCAALTELECGLEQEVVTTLSRYQALGGTALCGLGAGLFLVVNRELKKANKP